MRWSGVLIRFVVCIGSLALGSNASAEFTDVAEFGTRTAVCQGGVQNRAEFQRWTATNQDKVRTILQGAQWQGDPEVLLEAIRLGNFTEKEYYPGTSFEWSAVMKKGQAVPVPKKRWAGKDAFTGYEVLIATDGEEHTFIIPKVCCNFSLLWEGIPVHTPKAPKKTTKPKIDSPKKVNRSARIKPFSKLFVGSEKPRFKTGNSGTTVPDCTKCDGCKHCERHPVVVENDGKPATNTASATANASGNASGDRAYLFGATFGLEMPMSESLKFYPSVGLVSRFDRSTNNPTPGASIHVDVELRKSIYKNWFIGGGLGSWNVNDSDSRAGSVFISTGKRVNDNIGWFVEQRHFSGNSPGADHAFLAGIQLTFESNWLGRKTR